MPRVRSPLLAILLALGAPVASAATQVHVTYLGGEYAITFQSERPEVLVNGAAVTVERMPEEGGDDDAFHTARVPAGNLSYTVDGRTFRLRAPPAPHEPTRVAFVADMGFSAETRAIVQQIVAQEPDLVLIGGDLSYAHGNASLWDTWFAIVEPLAARVPTMPAFGNHEDYCEDEDAKLVSCGAERNEWRDHFLLPNAPHLYYAFDWGPMRVTSLDTETYVHAQGDHATNATEQERFLRASLDEDEDRWDVVMFHRPLRSTTTREGATSEGARAALGPTLDAHADVVLQAHLHAYERAKPGANGTVYVTSGGGGRSLYDEWGPEEPWLAARATAFHFVVLDVAPGAIDGRAIDMNGTEIDRFRVEREIPPSLEPPSPTPRSTPPTTLPPATAVPGTLTGTGTPTPPAPDETHDAPGPGVAALVLVLTLSARRSTRLARG